MGALEGVRVVDLCEEKGELCGRLMADLGAEVIRVEAPGGGSSRRMPPFAPDGETSLYFAFRNAGKRGHELDLSLPAGREQLHELLTDADFCLESFAPGALDRWGIGPQDLITRHPGLIVTSMSDFGQTGPYRDFLGTDMIGFAMGGMMHRAGIIEKPPLVAPGALAYDTVGCTAAFASLLAYWKRLRTGRGQHLDVSTMESVANLSDWALPNYSLNPTISHRAGAGFYTLYPCSDGFVRMIVLVAHHWRALMDWIGNPEELSDPALEQFIQRLIRQAEIEPVIARHFADQTKFEVAREAQLRGIPATPLLQPGEVLDNEHTTARGSFRDLEVATGITASIPSGFFTIDDSRAGPRQAPPRAGAADGFTRTDDLAREQLAQAMCKDDGDPHPFRGLVVIDFGVGAVGVEIGRLFAEYGADVIKVESAKAPDFIRIVLGSFMNANFASSSRSKRSFAVDLKTDRGRELVLELIRGADVAIENNGTGVMERLGLGWNDLQRTNPRLVSFTSQMVGSYGPWKDWIGYGPSTHPVSGLQYLWNYPEDVAQPAGSTNVYPDHFVARIGSFAIAAALIQRLRTGRGARIDCAQFEAAMGLLGDLFAQESLSPGSVGPLGNRSRRGAPWGAYPCAGDDEWCVINIRSDAEWLGLCRAMDGPEWATLKDFEEARGRFEAADEVDHQLGLWTLQHTAREVMTRLQAEGVPAGIVAHPGHHFEDPHFEARGYCRRIDQPGVGSVVFEGPAFYGSDLPDPIIEPAPLLGEHTRSIASEVLGLSNAEIEELISKGVLEDPPESG